MDLEILREFVSLSKSLNITQTSRELHISQSTLSSHIIKLEKDVGVRLVERKGTPDLTPSGRKFLEAASEILSLYDSFKAQVKCGEGKEEIIVIRVPQRREGLSLVLLQMVTEFKSQNPDLIVDMQDIQGNSVLEDLDSGAIDCGYYGNLVGVPQVDECYELVPLLDEEFVLWVDRASSLLGKSPLTPRELEGYQLPVPVGFGAKSYLNQLYEELFARYDATPNIMPRYCHSIDDFFLSKVKRDDLIVLNRGSQMVDAMNEANGKVARSFDPPIFSTAYLVFRRDDAKDAVARLKEYVRRSYNEGANPRCRA